MPTENKTACELIRTAIAELQHAENTQDEDWDYNATKLNAYERHVSNALEMLQEADKQLSEQLGLMQTILMKAMSE